MSKSNLTAPLKVKQKLIHMVTGEQWDAPEGIKETYDEMGEGDLCDALQDAMSELRYGTEETGLPCESSRHYESKAVAAQMLDGSWVGWTCWYGGGKHGEPETIEWIEDAYDVEMREVQKVVREFTLCGEKG